MLTAETADRALARDEIFYNSKPASIVASLHRARIETPVKSLPPLVF